jgi:tRNA-specific 2-thiouridylase
LSTQGEVIGSHPGATFFTIGQRHGFNASSDVPLYVCGIDAAHNTITVSIDQNYAARTQIPVHSIQWIREVDSDAHFLVQTRYREAPGAAHLEKSTLIFNEPRSVSSGQTAALYIDNECVGSAVIS